MAETGPAATARRRPAAPPAGLSLGLVFLLMACGADADGTASPTTGATADDDGPPSVVLIVVDTLRADRLGCYGGPRQVTPHMDALAARGVRFERTLAQSSWTLSSMLCLMSGRYLVGGTPSLPDETPTLAERFAELGHQTAAFVANGVVGREPGFDRGFDVFVNERDAELLPEDALHVGRQLNRRVLAWADDQARSPFLLYVHYMDPHAPYLPVDQVPFPDLLDEITPVRARRYAAHHAAIAADERAARDQLELVRRTVLRYDADVARADDAVGELLDGLERRGLLEGAVVVLTADHGEGLYERALPDHRVLEDQGPGRHALTDSFQQGHGVQLHRELLDVPFLVAGPGLPGGRVVREPVAGVDLLPTLVELAGGDPVTRVDGHSLAPLLRDPTLAAPSRQAVFSSCFEEIAVLDPATGWKLIMPTARGRRLGVGERLYDTRTDPHEEHDLLLGDDPEVAAWYDVWHRRLGAWEYTQRQAIKGGLGEQTLQAMRELGYIK